MTKVDSYRLRAEKKENGPERDARSPRSAEQPQLSRLENIPKSEWSPWP